MRAFLSYPYKPKCKEFVQQLKPFIEELDVDVIDGERPDATQDLGTYISESIHNCDLLISLLFEGIDSRWVDQEIGYALGAGQDVIVITVGSVKPSGIVSQQYHINYNNNTLVFGTALTKTLGKARKKLAAKLNYTVSSNAPQQEIMQEGWSQVIEAKIYKLRKIFEQANFGKVLELSTSYYELNPECWRFGIAQSSALVHLRRGNEALMLLENMSNTHQTNHRALSYIYDNWAWVISATREKDEKASLEKEIELYRLALDHEKRFNTYVNMVLCLLDLGKTPRADEVFIECLKEFPDSLDEYKKQISVQGTDFVRNIAKSHLISSLVFARNNKNNTRN